jgi:hypothetical protein
MMLAPSCVAFMRLGAPNWRDVRVECNYRIPECGYRLVGTVCIGDRRWYHESRLFDDVPNHEQVGEFLAYVANMKLQGWST